MPTNLSDQIADAVHRQAIDLMRFSEGLRETILQDMERLESQLVRALMDTAGKTDFTLARMRALLTQTRETIATAYKGVAADTAKSLESVSRIAATQTAEGINAIVKAQLLSVAMTPDQIKAVADGTLIAGARSKDWWAQQDKTLAAKFAREMRDGQYRGETVDQLVRRVRGTRAGGFNDGIMRATRAQAEALVRTSVLAVSNEARRAVYDRNRDVIKGIQHLSTLDERTTLLCISLDGLRWDYPEDGGLNYADFVPVGHDREYLPAPCHWNCRSVDIPITYSWEELAAKHGNSKQAKLAEEVPSGTRASMDGQVAASMTYDEWLTRQSAELQDEVLGARRAEMWRQGLISSDQLTDPANNVLTLSQLEAKYGAAEAGKATAKTTVQREWIDHVEGMPTDTLAHYTRADGTLTPERQRLHNDIVESFFKDATPVAEGERVAFVMMGGTASGKSTIVNELIEDSKINVVRIDADLVKERLPEYKAGLKASARDAAGLVHNESSVLADRIRERAINEGYNIIADGTGANADKYSLLLRTLSDKGYTTELLAAHNNVDNAIKWSAARAERTGRFINEDVIRTIFEKIPHSFAQNSSLADGFMLFDNTVQPPRLLWSLTKDGETIYDEGFTRRLGYKTD